MRATIPLDDATTSDRKKMLTIKCSRCGKKVLKYRKIGKGRLLHCWKERIVDNDTVVSGREVKCECGSLIGIDEGRWIRMKRHSFTCSGTASRR